MDKERVNPRCQVYPCLSHIWSYGHMAQYWPYGQRWLRELSSIQAPVKASVEVFLVETKEKLFLCPVKNEGWGEKHNSGVVETYNSGVLKVD